MFIILEAGLGEINYFKYFAGLSKCLDNKGKFYIYMKK